MSRPVTPTKKAIYKQIVDARADLSGVYYRVRVDATADALVAAHVLVDEAQALRDMVRSRHEAVLRARRDG